ncbi:MAG: hypothetical protein M0Z45_04865 [Actinomycetota bacterium]|nr:hypothetical protein [Actinomycetota bacterium]
MSLALFSDEYQVWLHLSHRAFTFPITMVSIVVSVLIDGLHNIRTGTLRWRFDRLAVDPFDSREVNLYLDEYLIGCIGTMNLSLVE